MNTNLHIRLARLLPILMVLALLAAACQPAAAPAPTAAAPQPTKAAAPAAAAAPTSAPAAAAAKGGELRIIFRGSEPKLLDAHQDPFDQAAMFSVLTSDLLIFKDKDLKFQPWLATEWNVSADYKTWTFKLRQDVKFHDGTPFNAEAVKFNFDRILDPKFESGQSRAMLGPVEKTEVVDPFTFRVVHKQPYPPFIDSIAEGFIAIWSPTAVQKYGINDFQRNMIGSGPFKLAEYKPADRYVFVKNPDYKWPPKTFKNQGPAYLDKITLRFINEAATALAAFQAGEADVVMSFPETDFGAYENNPKYTTVKAGRTGSPTLFVMNTSKAPLDDLKVRRAFNFATNPQELTQILFKGWAIPTKAVMYPGSPCYWDGAEKVYAYDLNKAKALLDEAGWKVGADGIREKDGKKLQISLVNSFQQELAPAVQAQLKVIGVDAKIDQVAGPIQLERAASGDFNLIIQHMAYVDPGVLDMLYNSKNLKPGGWSWTRFKDAKLDSLLDEAMVTVDIAKRCQLLTEAQKIIVDNAIVMPYYGRYSLMVMTSNVKDLSYGPRPNVDLWVHDAYVEKK